jgi:hypothetical protein
MNNRERLGVILKLLGLHDLEWRLYRMEVAAIERRERARIRFLATVIPAAVWTSVAVYAAAVLARGLRPQPAHAAHPQPLSDVPLTTDRPASTVAP